MIQILKSIAIALICSSTAFAATTAQRKPATKAQDTCTPIAAGKPVFVQFYPNAKIVGRLSPRVLATQDGQSIYLRDIEGLANRVHWTKAPLFQTEVLDIVNAALMKAPASKGLTICYQAFTDVIEAAIVEEESGFGGVVKSAMLEAAFPGLFSATK
jgi:hypothetical protein